MAKELLKLLDNVKENLAELCLPSEVFTVTTLIHTHSEGVTRTGRISCKLDDLLAAITKINSGLNKVRKLEKKIVSLETALKKTKKTKK